MHQSKREVIFPRSQSKLYKVPLHTHPLPTRVCLVPNNFATTLCIRWGTSVIQTEGGPGAVHSVLMEEPGLYSGPDQPMPLAQSVAAVSGFMLQLMHAAV